MYVQCATNMAPGAEAARARRGLRALAWAVRRHGAGAEEVAGLADVLPRRIRDVDLDAAAAEHGCPLMLAAAAGRADLVAALVERGGLDASRGVPFSGTPLHAAAASGSVATLRYLLGPVADCSPNPGPDERGLTPVAVAAQFGHWDALGELLVRHGAACGRPPSGGRWSDDPDVHAFVAAWAAGLHPLQAERRAVTDAVLLACGVRPQGLAKLCGDYVLVLPGP